MTATVTQLGARALRKIGIAIVADTDRPAPAAIVAQAELASRALRAVGINPAPIGTGTATGITYAGPALATAALLKLAVIASDETPSSTDQAEALTRVSDVHDVLAGADYVTWALAAVPADVAEFYIIMTANLLAPQFGKPANMDAFTGAQGMVRAQALSGTYGQTLAVAKVAEVHEVLNAAGLVSWAVSAVPSGLAEAYVRMTAALLAPIFGYQQDAPGRAADKAGWDDGLASARRAAVISGGLALAEQKIQAVHYSLEARGRTRWTLYDLPVYVEEDYVLLAAVLLAPECGVKADPNWGPQAEMDLMRILALPSEREPVRAVYF